MAISLGNLLKLANFPEKQVDDLLAKEKLLTEEEKFELASEAWFVLSQKYYGRLNFEKQEILNEVKQGMRTYNANDFEEIQARLTHEFANKLEAAETQESIDDVRKQLEKFKSSKTEE